MLVVVREAAAYRYTRSEAVVIEEMWLATVKRVGGSMLNDD